MNGVHDMGGMQGFGPIQPEPESRESVFHEPWEARVFALVRAMGASGKWNIDASRFQREQIPPAEYLRMSYYEKWLTGLLELLVAKGLVTADELHGGHAAPDAPKSSPALPANKVPQLIARGASYVRTPTAAARFQVGQSIHTRNINPTGHTRLPRYARDKPGMIERIHGYFVFPDTNALYQGECPQYLYSVRFNAHDLWGEQSAARDCVYIDLWESYLDPA